MRILAILLITAVSAAAADTTAKNIILFLGDAMGVPTLHAASVYSYGRPNALYMETMPNLALMETSTASQWVTDSAAGMTAIVTGEKTNNGVISEGPDAVRGEKDGTPLKTILEYAEEHGLATGVMTNSPVNDATPAACYAHASDRSLGAEIFSQIWQPRFGDGIDLVIGPNRADILAETEEAGINIHDHLGDRLLTTVSAIGPETPRPIVLLDHDDFNVAATMQRAIEVLSRDPDGFFLMVESNCHTDNIIRGLNRVLALDNAVRTARAITSEDDTLILVTADHSYDFRIDSGTIGEPIVPPDLPASHQGEDSVRLPNVRRDDSHTGEQVVVLASGPGSERVHGFLANTDLFGIMMDATGWTR